MIVPSRALAMTSTRTKLMPPRKVGCCGWLSRLLLAGRGWGRLIRLLLPDERCAGRDDGAGQQCAQASSEEPPWSLS